MPRFVRRNRRVPGGRPARGGERQDRPRVDLTLALVKRDCNVEEVRQFKRRPRDRLEGGGTDMQRFSPDDCVDYRYASGEAFNYPQIEALEG